MKFTSNRTSSLYQKALSLLNIQTDNKLAKGAFLSILDQSILSFSNFMTGVLIARSISPSQFGTYSLLWASLLILSGFQNSLITGPLRVLGVRHEGKDANNYYKAQLILQLLLGCGLALVSGLVLFFFYAFDTQLIIVFGVCIFFLQLQELTRIFKLTKLSIPSLLWMDTITHGLRLGLLALLMLSGSLSLSTAFLAILFSSAFGGLISLRASIPSKAVAVSLTQIAHENWNYGRWLAMEILAYNASTPIYLYMTALWIDKPSVGALYAVFNIMNVLNILLSGATGFSTPLIRRKLLSNDYLGWQSSLKKLGTVLVLSSVAVSLVVSLFAQLILTSVYGQSYSKYVLLVWILGVAYPFRAVNSVFSILFRTAGLPQVGFYAQLLSAIVTLIISIPLLVAYGLAGAAMGVVVTQISWTIYYTYSIKKVDTSRKVLIEPASF